MSAVQADVISYNAAISACEKASEWQASLATLFELLGLVKFLLRPVCAGMRSVFVKAMLLYISCAIDLLDQFCRLQVATCHPQSKGTAKQWKTRRSCWIWRSSRGWRLQAGFCPTP